MEASPSNALRGTFRDSFIEGGIEPGNLWILIFELSDLQHVQVPYVDLRTFFPLESTTRFCVECTGKIEKVDSPR